MNGRRSTDYLRVRTKGGPGRYDVRMYFFTHKKKVHPGLRGNRMCGLPRLLLSGHSYPLYSRHNITDKFCVMCRADTGKSTGPSPDCHGRRGETGITGEWEREAAMGSRAGGRWFFPIFHAGPTPFPTHSPLQSWLQGRVPD